jgi:hypothetical protein
VSSEESEVVLLTNAVRQLIEIASALVYLHEQRIAHGDVTLVSLSLICFRAES